MPAANAALTDSGWRAASAQSAAIVGSWMPGIERLLASATIEAVKPGPAASCGGPECCS